jgi:DNA-binding Lrp family transcriptional regulator
LLRIESVSLDNEYEYRYAKKHYSRIAKYLDPTNIRIFSAMWKYGPRNLLEVSRRIGMPFTSVYHRISKIESSLQETGWLIPKVSQLGMVRVAVLLSASSGCEGEVTRALKAPNLWRSIGLCEGNFTHISIQLVPVKFLRNFRAYIQQLVDQGLVTNFTMIYTGDYVPNFPDFDFYDPETNRWKFDWKGWFAFLVGESPVISIEDPESYASTFDKKDMMIISELERDVRKSFVDIAKATGMTAQGVKYHFDQKLVPSGVATYFQFKLHPFPTEVSAYHEIMLEFNSKKDLDKFFSLIPRLFFVLGAAKVLRQNTLMLQTWMLSSQLYKLFDFLSHLSKAGLLKSYSSVRMDFASRQTQSISDELYDDEKGWNVDFEKCSAELSITERVAVNS